MFLNEHNLPFLLMDHLPQLLKSVCPDSEIAKRIKCSRTKATAINKECFVEEAIETICNNLDDQMYSLIIDETTDISTQKSLVVLIRFWDKDSVRDHFLGLIRMEKCTAEAIFNAIMNLLKKCNISVVNMLGLAADNAAVMMGNKTGVKARFKEINPNIYVLGCTCHTFHLCASAATQKLPKSIEEFSRNIYNYFSNSSNRSEGLTEFQEFTNIKPCKMLHPSASQTRWLSLQVVVERIIKSWDALKLYVTYAVETDNLNISKTILHSLNTPIVKEYLLYMSYILDIINKLNVEFQSESPTIHILMSRITELYKTILRSFMKPQILNSTSLNMVNPSNPDLFLTLDDIYVGTKVELMLGKTDIDQVEINKFKTNVLSFYVELATQIRKRFDFEDPVLKFLSILNPDKALSGEVLSIVKVLDYFPQLQSRLDIEKLNSEWRMLPDIEVLKQKKYKSFIEFWNNVYTMKNEYSEYLFPSLSTFVKILLCLPHSSACAERMFSQLTLMKTKSRNRLAISTCESTIDRKAHFMPKN